MARLLKKVTIASLFILLFALPSEAQAVYQGVTRFISTVSTVCGPTATSCNIIATGGAFHQLTWNVIGTLSACSVQVDSSADNITFGNGDIIASQTCTSNGQIISSSHIVNYVRVTITAITPVSTATLQVNLTGYQTSPSGGGTVTSVGGTAPISSSGGNTPVISCSTCAIGPGASTANHVAKFSGTDGLTLADGGAGGTGTVTNTAGNLTANSVMIGNAVNDSKVAIGVTVPSAGEIDAGTNGGAGGVIGGNGATSGKATITAPAVAGTSTNPWSLSNVINVPNGACGNTAYGFNNATNGANSGIMFVQNNASANVVICAGQFDAMGFNNANGPTIRSDIPLMWSSTASVVNAITIDTSVNRSAPGVVCAGTTNAANNCTGTFKAIGFDTNTNCSNAASPAVCGSATSGAVAVPTGTNPTLTINTTKITATSEIFLQIDESATIAATTCNTTLSSLVQPVITARSVGASFTIQIGAVITTNPVCVSYFIVNPV